MSGVEEEDELGEERWEVLVVWEVLEVVVIANEDCGKTTVLVKRSRIVIVRWDHPLAFGVF